MDIFKEIEINKIKSLENIRTRIKTVDVQDLMQNIKQQGLLQPIGVWKTKKGEYLIAYGNRRLESCKKLGWKTITARILGELDYEEMLIINTSENLHRKDVSVAEIGRICSLLKEKGLSIGEIAIRLGVSIKRIEVAVNTYKNIPVKHRKDIVFMRPGTKHKMGKIPASIYNNLMSTKQELSLNTNIVDKLIDTVKQKDLTGGHVKIVASLLREGATVKQAVDNLDDYNIRRVSFPINKKEELRLFKKHNLEGSGQVSRLFYKILSGEISGNKKLVFDSKGKSITY